MNASLRVGLVALSLSLVIGAAAGACGSSSGDGGNLVGGGDSGLLGDGDFQLDGANPVDGDFNLDGTVPDNTLAIKPSDPVVDVTTGSPVPKVSFSLTSNGATVTASQWSIDRGEIGVIDPTGVFTPSGTTAGKATISASYGSKQASTSVTVRLHATQNGDPTGGGTGGAGGWGGVGGEGTGKPVSATIKAVLDATPTADPTLGWLYPYDATVFPRGILAPLLQWTTPSKPFDAVKIHITETNYDYTGYFAATATPFIHHPIPQDVWKTLAYSNGGEPVTIELTFSSGNSTIGPIKETWSIAPGTLKGTVYYNSYGTNLAHNYCCTIGGANFGGATLGIKGSSTDPVLVAGDDNNCRVCHSVAANGSLLITQKGSNYASSSVYDLKTLAETTMAPEDGRFAYSGIFPDGTKLFSNAASVPGVSFSGNSGLYAVPSGTQITATIPTGAQTARLPVFSPDGKHLAFNVGTGGDSVSLGAMDYDGTTTFANFKNLFTPPSGTVVWPTFLPTSDAVVFELETVFNGRDFGGTRSTCDDSGTCSNSGTRAEIWWTDLKTGTAHRLDKLNGVGYIPKGANAHDDDATLNYEPTVNPVASGGYAWVVFTSRRAYGNVATINPYWSDPRFHDLSTSPTPKKLWVAAIDLNAPPGTDPSHPAFYLPAQELLAGNSRGYWVVDPCKADNSTCETGDECCGGYCRPATGGGFTCSSQAPTCAAEFDKCTVDADCCDVASGIQCIGGRCTLKGPR